MNRVKSFLTVVSLGLLAGCGGSDDADPNLQVGRISATPVENMRYKTNSREGKTTADGRFEYLPGETVSFFVGHIPFGSATAQAEVTLLDLAGTTDTGDRKVVNMSRFLQSLDDPADGVVSISYNMDVLGCTVDTEAFDFDQPTTFFA